MEPTRQLSEILPVLTDLVDGIAPEQLDAATPCDEFTVADILDHMVTLGGAFSYWFRGEDPPVQGPPEPDVEAVPTEAFRETMDALLAAVHSPGALQRTITAPLGQMQGADFARMVALDGLIHGWDLATATGQPYEPDSALVGNVDAFAQEALTSDRRGDNFKAATTAPATASRLEQLVAFTGRSL